MKTLFLTLFLFVNIGLFASVNDTIYTVQLVALRSQDALPELLVEPLAKQGFVQKGTKINVTKPTAFVYKENLPYTKDDVKLSVGVNKLCLGKFASYKEALLFYKKDKVTTKYFAKSTIASLTTDKEGKQHLSAYTLEASDKFMKPLVATIEYVLFYDLLSLFEENALVYDEKGIPVISLKGSFNERKVPFVVLWLIIGALFFTFKMKFINIRGFKHAIELVSGKHDDKETKGEVSHFQALATALSATVGLGNIAGVAVAISVGGAGATLWMVLGGLLGMSSKFVECTLGVKYRKISPQGVISGGPMYYLS